jgi:hypothetical protein
MGVCEILSITVPLKVCVKVCEVAVNEPTKKSSVTLLLIVLLNILDMIMAVPGYQGNAD